MTASRPLLPIATREYVYIREAMLASVGYQVASDDEVTGISRIEGAPEADLSKVHQILPASPRNTQLHTVCMKGPV